MAACGWLERDPITSAAHAAAITRPANPTFSFSLMHVLSQPAISYFCNQSEMLNIYVTNQRISPEQDKVQSSFIANSLPLLLHTY